MIIFRQPFTGFLVVLLALCFLDITNVQAKDQGLNTSQRFALNFNESMNRCLQSGCSNIEELIMFFTDEASYLDDSAQLWSGKASIRKRFQHTQQAPTTSDRIVGIDIADSLITLRLERRRVFTIGKYATAEVKPHIQLILLKGGRITRLISVIAPDKK